MAAFTLTMEPTFTAKAAIPIPGKKAVNIEFTFKHRNAEEFKAWFEGLGSYDDDTTALMDIASGWDLKDAFTAENVEKMVTNYLGSARAVLEKYIAENSGARLGN